MHMLLMPRFKLCSSASLQHFAYMLHLSSVQGICNSLQTRCMLTVVLYDLKKAAKPSSRVTLSIQSVMPLYGLLATCNRCFTTSEGVMTPSLTMVAMDPATAVLMG